LIPRGELWSPGVNFDPQGVNFDPQGWTLIPVGDVCSLWVKILCLPLHSSKQHRVFTGVSIPLRGQSLPLGPGPPGPLGANFTPRENTCC
jgi:hypothetical protein